MNLLKILPLLLFFYVLKSQDAALNSLWEASSGMYSSDFGVNGVFAPDDSYYELGVNLTASNLYKLQIVKFLEGEEVWSLTLDSSMSIDYIPTKLYWSGGNLYAAAYQIQSGQSRSMLFAITELGLKSWTNDTLADRVVTDLMWDQSNNQLMIVGSSSHFSGRDAFVEARDGNGNLKWRKVLDQYGYNDAAIKISLSGSEYLISGSSESGYHQWEMAIWYLRTDGRFIAYESGSKLTNSIDELSAGRLTSNGLMLVGQSISSGQKDLKLYAYDFNKNLLWMDTFDRQGLDDFALEIEETIGGNFIIVGGSTGSITNLDALIRAYAPNGNLLWSNFIDFEGGQDVAVDVVEDSKGNLLVLCNVESKGQTDVLLLCLDPVNGSEKWRSRFSTSLSLRDKASKLHVNPNGEIWVTYQEGIQNNVSVLTYEELVFPNDFESLSRSTMFIENRGQLRNTDNEPLPEFKYYSQGLNRPYYFSNSGFTVLEGGALPNSRGEYTFQRMDFNFLNSKQAKLSAMESARKETYFNIYEDIEAFESCETYQVLAYPGLYENIDAYMQSNSKGFKMSFLLKPGAKLEDIQIKISGASGVSLSNGNLEVQSINGPIQYLAPYSYNELGNTLNDACLEYELIDEVIRIKTTHCEISYPYLIHIRAGIGQNAAASAIDNMDWSTFYGGSLKEGANDMVIDQASGDIFIAGYAESTNLPTAPGITNSNYPQLRGLALKFDKLAELKWGLILGSAPGPSPSVPHLSFKAIDIEDNLSIPGIEIHLVGEYNGVLGNWAPFSAIPLGSYQQQNSGITGSVGGNPGTYDRDLVILSLNSAGTRIFTTPFGGNGVERVYTAEVRNGHFYFAGSTDNGSTAAASSKLPPSSHSFPVYDPSDGSFFQAVHPSPGNERAFVAALDLSTYQLSYSSLITKSSASNSDYTQILSLRGDHYVGSSANAARRGSFDNGRMFSSNLNFTNTQDQNRSYFSDVVQVHNPSGDIDLYYLGFDGNGNDPLVSSPYNSSYHSTIGEAYICKRREASVNWDTYFGPSQGQNITWNFNGGLLNLNAFDFPKTKGRMVYSDLSSTLFMGASTVGDAPMQSFPNYLNEGVNNSGSGTRADLYLAAFSSNSSNRSDYFNWGTMYGGACINCGGGLGSGFGEDYLSDLELYSDGTQEYLYVLGTSMSTTGSLSSNVDLFPVADLGLTNSYFQKDNGGSYDVVLSRFKVGDIAQGLGLAESKQFQSLYSIYPNPNDGSFKVLAFMDENISLVEIYSSQGTLIGKWNWMEEKREVEIDLRGLTKGVYVLKINGQHAQQIIIQ